MTVGGGGGGGSSGVDGGGMLAALVTATSKGRVEQARKLLQANPLLATTRDAQGWTPGLLAAYYDQPEVLELCLAKGARAGDVDTDTYRASALHWVAGHGRVTAVVTLVTQHGADPNLRDAEGQTPLHRACRSEHPLAVLALLMLGADPSAEAADGERPAQVAGGSRLARGFLRMAERACGGHRHRVGGAAWRGIGELKDIKGKGRVGGEAGVDGSSSPSSVALGVVYGRGYQRADRGASPSTRSTGSSSAGRSVYDADVESDMEEEEVEKMVLVGPHEGGVGEEDEEALLLGPVAGRWHGSSRRGQYRIVV